jgi:hypothetical protein
MPHPIYKALEHHCAQIIACQSGLDRLLSQTTQLMEAASHLYYGGEDKATPPVLPPYVDAGAGTDFQVPAIPLPESFEPRPVLGSLRDPGEENARLGLPSGPTNIFGNIFERGPLYETVNLPEEVVAAELTDNQPSVSVQYDTNTSAPSVGVIRYE